MRAIVLLLAAALCCGGVHAAVPHQINYQGYLTNPGGTPVNTTVSMTFKLWDQLINGNVLHTETQSVTVSNGVFDVVLGTAATLNAAFDIPYYLGVTVDPDVAEMAPRRAVVASPYAIRSATTEALAANGTNCPAGQFAAGVDAQGNAEGCTTPAGGGTVTNVTASAPLFSSGGTTPNISLTGVVPLANIPDLGAGYIKNTAALQNPGTFNISGDGLIGGNVGIGTATPTSKLQVQALGYGITQTDGTVAVGSFISAGSAGWFGTRSNHPLNFFTNDNLAQVTLLQNGNFGIGTVNPTTKLQVFSTGSGVSAIYGESASGRGVWGKSTGGSRGVYGESATGQGVYGISTIGQGVQGISTSGQGVFGASTSESGVYGETAVSSLTAGGVYGKGTGSGSIGVIGESNVANAVGVFGVSTSPAGIGVYARNNAGGRAIFAEGNVAQSLNSNGLVKAMVYVDPFLPADQYIVRCYNGATNQSINGCGFTMTRDFPGIYYIDFGFNITNRFVSLSVSTDAPVFSAAGVVGSTTTFAFVKMIEPNNTTAADRRFYLFIY